MIEFFVIDSGEVIPKDISDNYYFIMNNQVWCDNCQSYESTSWGVGFEHCIQRRPDIGWRKV